MTEVVLVEATDALTVVAVRGKLDAVGVGETDLKLTSHTVARRKPAVIDLSEVEPISDPSNPPRPHPSSSSAA